MKQTATSVLRNARERVAFGWCRRAFATDADGHPVDERDPRACRWCLAGAVCVEPDNAAIDAAIGELEQEIHARDGFPYAVVAWNDAHGRTKEEVLSLIDAALASLNTEE